MKQWIKILVGGVFLMALELGRLPACNEIIADTTIWRGSGNWTEAHKWSNGLPDQGTDVIIDSGEVVLGMHASCNNIHIASSSALVLCEGGQLDVKGQLWISSDSATMGVLIQEDGGILNLAQDAKIMQYIKANQWCLASSPVFGDSSYVFGSASTMYFEESAIGGNCLSDNWISGVPSDSVMKSMQAYGVYFPNTDGYPVYSGLPHNGELKRYLSYTPAGGKGWNLIGNPYVSYLDPEAFHLPPAMDKVIYTFDGHSGNYKAYIIGIGGTANPSIAPMEGFFVHVLQADTLYFTNKCRTPAFNYSSQRPKNYISAVVKSNAFHDEVLLYCLNGCTDAYDKDCDAYKIKGIKDAPQLYTVSSDANMLSINGIASIDSGLKIPLYFECGQDSIYYMHFVTDMGYLTKSGFTLEDKKYNAFHPLKPDTAFAFSSSKADASDRFILHINNTYFTEIRTPYSLKDQIYVHKRLVMYNKQSNYRKTLKIYDLMGRELFSKSYMAMGLYTIDPGKKEIILIQLTGKAGSKTSMMHL